MENEIDKMIYHMKLISNSINNVYFPVERNNTHELAYQVNFPRLEIILDGKVEDLCLPSSNQTLTAYDCLFIPAGKWNYPQWSKPSTLLNILFGKQHIGFSLERWDEGKLIQLGKRHVARRGPRVGSHLLQTLHEISVHHESMKTARFVINALISHCEDLLGSDVQTGSKSEALYEAVRVFIEKNHMAMLTRESVAAEFYITPNYLSHLFQKTGGVGFNEYLNYVRLEHAKELLKKYDMKVKEIAVASGFSDSNYFCRVFRKATARSPSEYRQQYHSQFID